MTYAPAFHDAATASLIAARFEHHVRALGGGGPEEPPVAAAAEGPAAAKPPAAEEAPAGDEASAGVTAPVGEESPAGETAVTVVVATGAFTLEGGGWAYRGSPPP